MTFQDLPQRIAKTFTPEVVARIGTRKNKNGEHITVVTCEGMRYRYQKKGDGQPWLPLGPVEAESQATEPQAVTPLVDVEAPLQEGFTGFGSTFAALDELAAIVKEEVPS